MQEISGLVNTPFREFALLFGLSAVAGAVAIRLRQPLLVAFILVGILAGPSAFGIVQAHEQIDLLAQIGITVLLFAVGLKLDLGHVRNIGAVALATGLGQLTFTIVVGFALTMLLGKDWVTALYVAVALTFSSTIIIVKLLSDKREIDALHGRIAVGFLIVQDMAVVIAMMTMSAMRGTGADTTGWMVAGSLALRIAGAAALTFVAMRYILPRVVDTLARSQELLLIFAIAWGTSLAALGEYMGFSKEAGAFLAGFSLASTAYRDAIGARLSSLRDFLLLFFFLDLGAKLDFSTLGSEVVPSIVLALFVLIGNPLIVMAIMGYMGYRARTGFLAGLTVAQISEFSIIFIALGIGLGHIGPETLGLTTLVGLITITLSTYLILFSHPLYDRVAKWLKPFERTTPFRELQVENREHDIAAADAIVIGLGRYGRRLADRLINRGITVLGLDFDPEAVRSARALGVPVMFGDAESPDVIEMLPLTTTRWVVSTVRDERANRLLVDTLQGLGYDGHITLVSDESRPTALSTSEPTTAEPTTAKPTAAKPASAEPVTAGPTVRYLHPFRDAADYAALDLAARIVGARRG